MRTTRQGTTSPGKSPNFVKSQDRGKGTNDVWMKDTLEGRQSVSEQWKGEAMNTNSLQNNQQWRVDT